MGDKTSAGKKDGGWLVGLFALPFAGVGLGLLVMSVIPTLYQWSRMQHWQLATATLSHAYLQSHPGDDSTTYSVSASYTYTIDGVTYSGERVAIGSSADNIGRFQQDLGQRLERALAQGRAIDIWVNPDDPAEAVIDRSLRPGLLAFKMVFVLVFGGVGCGLLAYQFFFRNSNRAEVTPANIEKPWLQRADWLHNRIGCGQKSQLWFAWIFAAFWNLISTPLAFVVPAEIHKGNYPALLGLLFPLVGIGLLLWAIKITRDWRRFGNVFMELDPFPGSIGGQVGGAVELPIPYDNSQNFSVTLSCIYSYSSGSGKNRSTHHKSIWQSEGIAEQKTWSSGIRLQFLFDVPEGLPASEPEELPYHSWRVTIKNTSGELNFARQFVIPVYATATTSRYIREKSIEHPAVLTGQLEQIESICDIAQIPGGVELFFPIFRSWQMPLTGLVFGSIFAAAGGAIGYADGPIIFPVVFGGIGSIVVLASLKSLFDSRRVRLDHNGYLLRKWWLGIPVGTQNIPRGQLRRLRLKENYSTQSADEHVTVYKIQLELDSGKSVFIADSLRGEPVARRLMENISLYSEISS